MSAGAPVESLAGSSELNRGAVPSEARKMFGVFGPSAAESFVSMDATPFLSFPPMTLPSDISREDLLILLASIGVVLPKDTKLSVEDLDKRLIQALDTSQGYSDLLNKSPVNVSELPLWPRGKALAKSTVRGNFAETISGKALPPKTGGLSDKMDTFKEMRQSVWALACAYDEGVREIYFRDSDMKWSLYVRIMNVYELDGSTPLFNLSYRQVLATPTYSLESLEKKIQFKNRCGYAPISDLERRTLLRLFRHNEKRLYSDVLDDTQMKKSKDDDLHQTFVLPLIPIGMQNLGKLADPGCEVCGKKTSSRCVQCLSVVYCGKECQKADWPTHKEACKSIKGGKWEKVTLAPPPAGVYIGLVNRLDGRFSASGKKVDGPPIDVQNGKVFLAKIQVPASMEPLPGDMLVYDRQRSFTLFWNREPDPMLFGWARRMMGNRLKFYRWMRHTGGYDFEICIDRVPTQDPVW